MSLLESPPVTNCEKVMFILTKFFGEIGGNSPQHKEGKLFSF